MNIAIFTDSFIPLGDGIVTSTLDLVKGLSDKGNKIYVIAPHYKNSKEFSYPHVTVKRMPGIPALFYPGFKFTSPLNINLIKYLKKKKIDVIHFQTPFTVGAQAILTAKILKKPLIGTFHTFITDEQYIRHIGINLKFIQHMSWTYVRSYYNKCDLITCPSESAKEELIKNKFIKPIKIISNGIDLSSFDNSNWKEIVNKYDLRGKTLLFVGRIAHEKNIDYLIKCFKLVQKKIPNIKLLIVGNGPQMDQLQKLVKGLDLSDNIIFTRRIDHAKLLKSGIYKASNLFVTASKTESQGITTLEAQANGLVCIGVNARGTKDLIKDGYNGYLVKEGDKKEFANRIIALIMNKKLYDRMAKNTLKEIKKHDLKLIITEWEKVYRSLVIGL